MQHEKNGIKYWTYGDKKNYPILLVHGFTGSHEGFQYLIPELEKYFYVIAPDLPGFGKSREAVRPWTAKHLAAETNTFVRSLALSRTPHLVSHSMGGLIAASMLAQAPELYDKKTIFISPVATKIGLLDGRRAGALAGRLQYAIGHHIPKIAASKRISRIATMAIMTTKDRTLKRQIHEHHLDNLNYISSSKYYHDMHVSITRQGVIDFTEQLRPFSVAIITGANDNVTPLKGVKMLASALDAELTIIPKVGHLAHYETPEKITSAMLDFLK
jgi:esterase